MALIGLGLHIPGLALIGLGWHIPCTFLDWHSLGLDGTFLAYWLEKVGCCNSWGSYSTLGKVIAPTFDSPKGPTNNRKGPSYENASLVYPNPNPKCVKYVSMGRCKSGWRQVCCNAWAVQALLHIPSGMMVWHGGLGQLVPSGMMVWHGGQHTFEGLA